MVEVKEAKDNATSMELLNTMNLMEHEQVVFCQDKHTGLKAIIAIHNTVLGPSLGGTRMWNYNSEAEALKDVLRLSRGMSFKSAISGINLGGGKAVIIGDARTQKNEALMRRFGKFVDSLSGKYITAEDVGMTTRDMEYIKMETDHVAGLPDSMGGSGDPSPVTAYGVFMGMKACAKERFGSDSLSGKKVLVQGIGNVGKHLVAHLVKDGAVVYINDIFEDKLKAVAAEHKVEVVSADSMFSKDIDIYAPCALGATVNTETLSQLKCGIIAGAANNQLADEKLHGEMVMKKGIIYAPDFLINAGGVINCYYEVYGPYNRKRALDHAEKIYGTTADIIKYSKDKNVPTYLAANKLAEERISSIAKINQTL